MKKESSGKSRYPTTPGNTHPGTPSPRSGHQVPTRNGMKIPSGELQEGRNVRAPKVK